MCTVVYKCAAHTVHCKLLVCTKVGEFQERYKSGISVCLVFTDVNFLPKIAVDFL